MLCSLWKMLLISLVSVSLVRTARAETIDTAGKQLYAGIAVAGAAVAAGVVLIVLHEKHKTTTITGCVTSAVGAMNLTDEKDKQIYALSGASVGVKPGDRMTLAGRRHGKVFKTGSVVNDLGVCQPPGISWDSLAH
jgi:hypothetical protein